MTEALQDDDLHALHDLQHEERLARALVGKALEVLRSASDSRGVGERLGNRQLALLYQVIRLHHPTRNTTLVVCHVGLVEL